MTTTKNKPISSQISPDGQHFTEVFEIPEKDRAEGGFSHNTVTRDATFEEQIEALAPDVADQVKRMIPMAYDVEVEAKGRTMTLTLLDEGELAKKLDKATKSHEKAARDERHEGPARGQSGEGTRPKPGDAAVKEKVETPPTSGEKSTSSGGKVAQ